MSLLTTHRFTVDELVRMAATGVISRDSRVELIEGEIVDMFPIGPYHHSLVTDLAQFLVLASKERWMVSVQGPLKLSEDSLPQPDLLLFRRSAMADRHRHITTDDVFLVIEVADSSLAYDRKTKLRLYARARTPEVWIFNVKQRKVEVYREPGYSGYGSVETVPKTGRVSPLAFPDLSISLAEFLVE